MLTVSPGGVRQRRDMDTRRRAWTYVGDGERDGGEVCAGGVSAKEPAEVGLALEDFGERGVEGLANELDAGDVVG